MNKTRRNVSQRLFLISLLVKRNIKNQYYRSFIGVVWTVLNPLLNMAVMWFVFEKILGRGGTDLYYPIFILSGTIIYNVMSSSTSTSLGCLVGQSSMLQKTKVPIEIFPTANVFSALVTFGFSFIALMLIAIICAITGAYTTFSWTILLLVALLPPLVVFSLGISFFLSALYVFFRDIKHVYSVILTLWRFLTPIYYTMDGIESNLVATIMRLNPMYHYVEGIHKLLSGEMIQIFSLNETSWLAMYGFAAISLVIGWLVLKALRNKIAANL